MKSFWLLLLTLFPFISLAQEAVDLESGNTPDYINCGNHPSLNITGTSITLEAWINPESFAGAVWGGNIINKSGGGDHGYMLRVGGTGQVNFNIGSFGWNEITSGTNVVTTNAVGPYTGWYHVAGTYDGATMRLYVNGAQVASSTSFTGNIGSATNNLLLGEDPGFSGRYYDGFIEEVKIWNVARTASEVLADMDPIVCTPYPAGLVAYYKFNEGVASANNAGLNAPNNIIDEIGNNTGSLLNSSYNGGSSNWVSGRPDPALSAAFTLTAVNCNTAASTITGTSGGTFSWNPNPGDGAILNAGTGEITGGTAGSSYTIDYTVCGLTTTESVTLPSGGNASFSLTAACGGANATITGDAGGTFAFNPAPGDGALINSATGQVTNGTVGTSYTVEYTVCGTTSLVGFTVLDDNCWVLNGDAQYITVGAEQCIQLTDEFNDQTGCAWNESTIDFANDFTLTLDYYFGNNINGADGNTFTFQPSSSTTCGSPGAQLGAGGIANALSIEFDTYDNDNPWHVYDMLEDHIAVEIDGDHQNAAPLCGPVSAKPFGGNIDNGIVYNVEIQWDASTNQLDIYFDGNLRLSCTYDFVNNVFGGQSQVYWGATSATGGLNNEQYFCPSSVTLLPVEMAAFTSKCEGDNERFLWTTISENRVDYFQLEYTYDGLVFYPVDKIEAIGNSTSEVDYSYILNTNDSKQRYYRLKSVDEDGEFEYTDIISSNRCGKSSLINLVQQKENQTVIQLTDNVTYSLINQAGQVLQKASSENNSITIQHSECAAGLYIIRVVDAQGYSEQKKVIIH